MRSKELDVAIAILSRMAAQPGLETVRLAVLQQALRELKRARHSGKGIRKRTLRVTKLLAQLLEEPDDASSDK